MSDEPKDPAKKDPFVIHVADFSKPYPFKTTQGAFHSYTYLPFVGWLGQTEFMLVIAVAGVLAAILVPQLAKVGVRRREAALRGELGQLRTQLRATHRLPDRLPKARLQFHSPYDSVVTLDQSDDRGGWALTADGSEVYVNCTHTDSRGTVWTSY